MDQEPSKWIKKEETDELQTEIHFMAQVYPCSMNVKEELEKGVNKEWQIEGFVQKYKRMKDRAALLKGSLHKHCQECLLPRSLSQL
ncbi:uncharacterized protein LOC126213262 isoform X2 [Schistocerca nitens]|uniref:uncharacterized protein LOC126213262 isoform X2 n=1 Tax=Schistocerca nitens TaxID=7011 RepID=UPI0021191B50|nr:uncharacterized protein LOC126213262 isoform X2 [Schistocerca nitens]